MAVRSGGERFRFALALLLAPVSFAFGTAAHGPALSPERPRMPIIDGGGIRFTRISPSDGLSQTRVAQIIQDDQGFMWFGTQHGLNRYDGYKFRVFTHDPEKPNSISGNFIYSLFKDRSGMLWIGCGQTLDRFDPATEEFTHYRLGNAEESSGPVMHISQDRTGLLWLASATGLRSFDPRAGKVMQHFRSTGDPSGLLTDDIRFTGEDSVGTFWVGTSDSLNVLDRASGRITMRIPLQESWRVFFYEDRSGTFWILTGGGLSVLDRAKNVLTQYAFCDKKRSSFPLTGLMDMVEDRDGNLWLGSTEVGLLRLDRENKRFIRYRNRPGNPESLGEEKVICLYVDREGNIWTGLNSKGPNHFNPRPALFEQFRHEPGNPNSLDVDLVNAIYEDSAGLLWIGNDNGLVRIDRKTRQYSTFTAGLEHPPMVIAIIGDGAGGLWLGTSGRGITHFDPKTGRFRNYRHDPQNPSTLSDNHVHRLFIDRSGTLWALTENGLDRFDARSDTFKTYRGGTQYYVSIAEDETGLLWLGTNDSGLQSFDPTTERFTQFKPATNDSGAIGDNPVTKVLVDGPKTLWLATYSGLKKFDRATKSFRSYDERNGLAGGAVACVLPDSTGDLWMSTNQGISSFHPATGAFKNYSTDDGLPGNDLTGWEACYKSGDGEMFFGGFSGAVAFRPELLANGGLYAPPVSLTDFRLSGVPVAVGGNSPLRRSITYTDHLVLRHGQSTFSLTFSTLSYLSPANNRYRYKLDELDRDWHEVGSDERLAAYTALPAGHYTFRAQGATSRGPWSEPGVVLQIEVLPPFWATLWFRTSLTALLLATLWWAHHLRLQQTARQFDRLLDERINERTRIARELHDTLLQSFHGLLPRFQAACNLLPGRALDARQVLQSALDDAGRAITEARDAVQDLRSSTILTNDLTKAIEVLGEELRVNQRAADGETTDFSLQVEGTPQDLRPIIRDQIYRITGEALRNAFRHAKARRIEVEIRYDTRQLRVRVRDDGIGIDPSVLRQEGRPGHFGLKGMRERSKGIGLQLEVWSERGAGTEVELTAPSPVAYGTHSNRRFRFFRSKKGRTS